MLIPVGSNLLLKVIQEDEMTAGGIYIPDASRVTPDKGEIVMVGDDVEDAKLTKGVTVLFRKNSGHAVTYKDENYIILPLKEVIGIIKGE